MFLEKPKSVILSISQNKFNIDGSVTEGYHWMIPLTICTSSKTTGKVNLLLKTSSTDILLEADPSQWIKINVGTIGFYRTKYTDEMLEQFLPDIQNQKIPPSDRYAVKT